MKHEKLFQSWFLEKYIEETPDPGTRIFKFWWSMSWEIAETKFEKHFFCETCFRKLFTKYISLRTIISFKEKFWKDKLLHNLNWVFLKIKKIFKKNNSSLIVLEYLYFVHHQELESKILNSTFSAILYNRGLGYLPM